MKGRDSALQSTSGFSGMGRYQPDNRLRTQAPYLMDSLGVQNGVEGEICSVEATTLHHPKYDAEQGYRGLAVQQIAGEDWPLPATCAPQGGRGVHREARQL